MGLEAEKRILPTRSDDAYPTISEIILENFMSYEYGRIPLKKGINVVTGPNGAGKSTILLAISVALGQAYTERSRKLSDLIRRDQDIARVSLLFENRMRNGRRPVPFSKSDKFILSRYLKSDGTYWYEADYREISRSEVSRLFRKFGINPDNLLIIMHQGMVEEFGVISAQDKLKMVEEAVGFREYREGILESRQKLSLLVTEQTDASKMLESADNTLGYWKEVYDRYLKRKELMQRKEFLGRELVWSQVIKVEQALSSLRMRLDNRQNALERVVERMERTGEQARKARENIDAAHTEQRKLYFALLRQEKEKAEALARIDSLKESGELLAPIVSALEEALGSTADTGVTKSFTVKIDELRFKIDSLSSKKYENEGRVKYQDEEIRSIQKEVEKLERSMPSNLDKFVGLKVNEAMLGVRRKNIEREISDLERSIRENEDNLGMLLPQAKNVGPRVETERSPPDVVEEIKITDAQIRSLGEIPDDAEAIYNKFSKSYDELKDRLAMLAENKSKTLKELDERKKVWKQTLQDLVEQINPLYQDILSNVNALGIVRLVDMEEDIEKAGLELLVGFRGAPMAVLDAYTQSGGERGVSVMAFLLSLQQRLLSPFRAIDEFDVHLDPRNREAVLRMIFSHMKSRPESQHIVITPSQLTVMDRDAHIVFVQNTYGRSSVKLTK
ncbi:MAG: AAA family ATPase [Nitrososphaerales archaeon]